MKPAELIMETDPAESGIEGWRIRVIEWASDKTVVVISCHSGREADDIERDLRIAEGFYAEIDDKPRKTTTQKGPDA